MESIQEKRITPSNNRCCIDEPGRQEKLRSQRNKVKRKKKRKGINKSKWKPNSKQQYLIRMDRGRWERYANRGRYITARKGAEMTR